MVGGTIAAFVAVLVVVLLILEWAYHGRAEACSSTTNP
jgi:hypothetical protein